MYSIKYVSTVTGIGVHTLRAWERRYDIIKPVRSEKGRRTYSEEELSLLKIISELVHLGEPIGTLAKLNPSELTEKWDTLQDMKSLKGTKYERFEYSLIVLRTALSVSNKEVIVHELTTLQSEMDARNFTIDNFIEDFAIPFHNHLSKADYNDPEKGSLLRLSYMLLTQLLRQGLAMSVDQFNDLGKKNPVLIGSAGTIRGEIDGLICTIRSYLQGIEAIYIGSRLSQDVITEFVANLGAEKVIITDRKSPFKQKLNVCEVFDKLNSNEFAGIQWAVLLSESQTTAWPCCVPHKANLKTYNSFESLDQFLKVS